MKFGTKYANRLISDTGMEEPKPIPGVKSTHLMKVDESRLKDFFGVDCTWYWSAEGEPTIIEAYTPSRNQEIAFIGLNEDDPNDLNAEITVWIDGKKEVLTRSCIIFVAAGTSFGPVQINKMNNPVFHCVFTLTEEGQAKLSKPDKKYSIVTTHKEHTDPMPEPKVRTMKSKRILHIEDDIVKGAFYVDFVWLYNGYNVLPAPPHEHGWEELIAMAGADPENPRDIGGVQSLDLDLEPYLITKSTLVCIPKDVSHCPWKFLDVRTPTLVWSALPVGLYSSSISDKW